MKCFLPLLLFLCFSSARADAPLPPPAEHHVKSLDGRYEARFTPSPAQTAVFELETAKLVWSKQGFHRHAFLANDGQHLVASYDGYSLIPTDAKSDLVLLEFFEGPKSIKRVTLGEIIHDPAHLRRTVSHLHWGYSTGFDGQGHFCLETVEGRRLKFDARTGHLAAEEPVKPN